MKARIGNMKVFSVCLFLLGLSCLNLVTYTLYHYAIDPKITCTSERPNYLSIYHTTQPPIKLIKYYRSLIQEIQKLLQQSLNPSYLLYNDRHDYSQYKQSTVLIRDIFRCMKNGTFFEAGALDGELISNTLMLEREFSWTGVLVEPDPVSFLEIKKKGRKAWLLNACIGTEGKHKQNMIFRTYKDAKWGNRLLNTGIAPIDPKDSYDDVNMTCFPLAAILLACNLSKIDLLILDLEGAEPMVIQNFPWKSFQINVVMLECFGCLNKNGVVITKDNELLRKRAFFKSFMEQQGFYEKHFIPKSDIIYVHKSFSIY